MNTILNRRSIRNFKAQEVEKDKLERILRAGMHAPSAHNFQPWEFIVVKDKEMQSKIADLSKYGTPAKKSDTCIVVLTDMNKIKNENLWWQQDMGACVENMLLQVVEEDLGAVWLGYYPEDDRVQGMKELFNLPDNLITFAVIAIGYPNETKKFEDRYDTSKVHYEKYTG